MRLQYQSLRNEYEEQLDAIENAFIQERTELGKAVKDSKLQVLLLWRRAVFQVALAPPLRTALAQ